MSRVFLAHEQTLGRDVVVKVLPPEMAGDVNVDRFEREIRLAARLQHPHIVPVLSAGETNQLPYFVMPYIAGESLRERLRRERELPVVESVRLLRDVAVALDYAHTHGIVHRDIKPENILLSGGTAVVTDFGVAKALEAAATGAGSNGLTSVGVALGTPAYMAPEQVAADPAVDHRADIYAWGTVAYEILTGSTPFGGRAPQALFAAHMAEVPKRLDATRPGVPSGVADLVMRTLEKRPADRPQSAAEIVQTLDSLLASGVTTVRSASVRGARRRPSALVILAAVGAIAVAAGLLVTQARRERPANAATSVKSIAVLPFVDVAGGDDYFAEGMSDELSAALGRVPGLQVASRTSTFAFKAPNVDVREVGQRLRVDAVLEGRVRRAGDRLRVTAQLTDASTGLSLWTDSYERGRSDVFAVQDEIARAIASALELRLAAGASSSPEMRGTTDLAAYDLYLRGRYHWHRRGADNLRSAIRYFEQAIRRDPNFGRAHAGLAIASVLIPEYSDAFNMREMGRRAESSATRALELDSTLAEAYAARGLARVHEWDWDSAERAYRKALQLDSRYPTAHQWYGEFLYQRGRTGESVVAMRRSAELDPLSSIAAVALSYALYVDRQYEEALREARRSIELAPELGIAQRAIAYPALMLGDSAAAWQAADRAVRIDKEITGRLGQRAYVAGRLGRTAQARADLATLLGRPDGAETHYARMWAYLGLGDVERSAREFERAVAMHAALLTGYSTVSDPAFDALRGHPVFERGKARMGLPSVSTEPARRR